MSLLAVERIKLFSTRSPWWCMVVALALTIGFAALIAGMSGGNFPLTLPMTQFGVKFGLLVVMVMAALAVTTEYRFGTIRATFQAVPNRVAALTAKTAVVGALALVLGEVASFGSWAVAKLMVPDAALAISTADDWRQVAGVGLVFTFGAIIAIAVGILLRQSAGAITLLLIWSQLVETLVVLIPEVGVDIQKWLPFTTADRFLTAAGEAPTDAPFGPWGSLAYFGAVACGLLIAALVVAHRRDA
jgi:ABC-2 type transport system permease protein